MDQYAGNFQSGQEILIPAGDTRLLFTGYTSIGNSTYTGTNMLLIYTFAPGKSYNISFFIKNRIFGVNIYEGDKKDPVFVQFTDFTS